jgi:hypothetical protein
VVDQGEIITINQKQTLISGSFWPIAACYEAQLSAQDPKRDQHNDFW